METLQRLDRNVSILMEHFRKELLEKMVACVLPDDRNGVCISCRGCTAPNIMKDLTPGQVITQPELDSVRHAITFQCNVCGKEL